MTIKKETGGPAFPSQANVYRAEESGSFIRLQPEGFEGMTLRDYAAIKAMGNMISTAAAPCLLGLDGAEELVAKYAYKMADAMLAERSK